MEKILFIDVDGTLVDYENNLPTSAVDAIRKARENGHKVFITTGRSKAEVYSNILEIGLDGMIGGNGSFVESDGNVIMHQLITLEQCRHIVDWLHERGLEFYLESNNGLFASENFETGALDAIAFGDAEVDLPMFECCSYSVCMGNGRVAAKEAADYVTDSVENDGLYKAFCHLGLI